MKKNEPTLYGIIGLGRFGFAVAKTFAENNREIIAVDKDEHIVREATAFTDNAYVVSDLSRESLQETGIQNCDIVFVCIGEAIDTSILTTLIVMQLGVKRVVAKAIGAEHGSVLEKLGAETVYPERDMGTRTAKKIMNPHLMDYLSLDDEMEITEITLCDKIEGSTVEKLNIRKKYGLNIIGVKQGGKLNFTVTPTLALHAGDHLVVMGKDRDILRFEDELG
jgi:trk system potassium uptake protein TrkA